MSEERVPPRNFLGLPAALSDFRRAGVVILPVPYEATVSYMGGARHGPQAIIDASRAVELYDIELNGEPVEIGVATAEALALTNAGPEAALRELRRAYAAAADSGKFVIMLGGEHSLSGPPILEWAARLKRVGRRLSVLQLDAHGDLRDSYEGTPFSHASVMRRIVDQADLVQVGIRAISIEERRLMRRRADTITTIFGEEIQGGGGGSADEWIDRALGALGDDVYLTIDVDFFDPALVPSTGTPEPGGGQWHQALRLLRRVLVERNVVAADVVELAPIPGLVAPDFLVAKLVYKLIGYYREGLQKKKGGKKTAGKRRR
jgi:agmatinase